MSNTLIALFGFIKLSAIVLFIAHWTACFWNMVGEAEGENSWLHAAKIENDTWKIRYISSIYWVKQYFFIFFSSKKIK